MKIDYKDFWTLRNIVYEYKLDRQFCFYPKQTKTEITEMIKYYNKTRPFYQLHSDIDYNIKKINKFLMFHNFKTLFKTCDDYKFQLKELCKTYPAYELFATITTGQTFPLVGLDKKTHMDALLKEKGNKKLRVYNRTSYLVVNVVLNQTNFEVRFK